MSQNSKYISLDEASKFCPYSQEYLSLLARKGKLKCKKIGRNWFTTRENLDEYLKKQSVLISLPKSVISSFNPSVHATLASSLTPEDEETIAQAEDAHIGHSKLFEEFEKLNPQLFNQNKPIQTELEKIPAVQIQQKQQQEEVLQSVARPSVTSEHIETSTTTPPQPQVIERTIIQSNPNDEKVMTKIDRLTDSLTAFAETIAVSIPKMAEANKIQQPPQIVERIVEHSGLSNSEKEFINIESQSLSHKAKKLNFASKQLIQHPVRLMAVMITAIVTLFMIVGGFSFGAIDDLAQSVKKVFTDAETLGGHFAGTHANEVLVLDKAGNISIFGHIETEGQLRSKAPDGVAPIVVDSMTKVDNLNADFFDSLDTKDFTLAFVTKNGNVTYEDVLLEGNVEVGKTLTVKGAVKLMDSLNVYGKLGVFSDAVFGKDITLTQGNLNIDKGTIVINNNNLIENLNAEYLDGITKKGITLDFVTENGNTTSNDITIGGIYANGMGFFSKGIWGSDGAFGTLGVSGDTAIGDSDHPQATLFSCSNKTFSIPSLFKIFFS